MWKSALNKLGIASIRPDKLSLLRRADIAAVRVRALGQAGNHHECVRAVLDAERLFEQARSEQHPDLQYENFGTYYTDKLLASDLAHGLFALSYRRGLEVSHTVERLHAAAQLSDEHARSRLLSSARLAALHLRRGDVEEGLMLAGGVLEAARGTSSIRVTDDLRRIYALTRSPRVRKAPSAGDLRHRTLALLRSL